MRKMQKKFSVGMLRSHIMTMRYMGIENMKKMHELYKKEKEIARELHRNSYTLNYELLYFENDLAKCPYRGADKKYFKETMHFL